MHFIDAAGVHRAYVNGTRPGQHGSADFAFDWTPPPATKGDVVVYVTANAANADGNTGGDHNLCDQLHTEARVHRQPSGDRENGRGRQRRELPGGHMPGSWVTIQGTKLANSSRTWRTSEIVNGKLPTQLDGVSVQINGKPAYVEYISPTQINVQEPSDTALGPVNVQVTNNSVTGDPVTAQLQAASPHSSFGRANTQWRRARIIAGLGRPICFPTPRPCRLNRET